MGDSKVATSELTEEEAETVHAQLEFAIERNKDLREGVIACGLAVAATTCASFEEEEIGC